MNAVFACSVGHFFLLPCDLQKLKLNFTLGNGYWCQKSQNDTLPTRGQNSFVFVFFKKGKRKLKAANDGGTANVI